MTLARGAKSRRAATCTPIAWVGTCPTLCEQDATEATRQDVTQTQYRRSGRRRRLTAARHYGLPRSTFSYYTYLVEILSSARRHGVRDEDIAHAFEHIVSWLELDDDPPRYLVAGPDRAGNLLELVVVEGAGDVFVIHAMAFPASTRDALFGDDRS